MAIYHELYINHLPTVAEEFMSNVKDMAWARVQSWCHDSHRIKMASNVQPNQTKG